MEGKNLKERGITLIALVITIIVLLILAGVTISIVLHTGIIDNSQKAVDQYAYEQQREQDLMANITNYLNNYTHRVPIYTVDQLKEIGSGKKITIDEEKIECEFTNSANYVLMADIDLNQGKYTTTEEGITFNPDAEQWTPIGTEDEQFKGTFNGNGHTISGIYINEEEGQYKGLFGVIEDSTIENLTVSGSIIGNNALGGIAGQTRGKTTINNCHNLCNISGVISIGGITGSIQNGNVIISNCLNKGDLSTSGSWANLGGIVGTTNGENNKEITITNCYNEGIIKGEGTAVGGILGEEVDAENNTLIENCYNKGYIKGGERTAGILGSGQYYCTVKGCYNEGNIEAGGQSGGIVGKIGYRISEENKILIEDCYNIADVNGDARIGGIIGDVDYYCTIRKCYNEGDINGTGWIGGIAGDNHGHNLIELCYNSGNITAETESAAGITAVNNYYNEGTVKNSYNTGEINGKTCAGGIVGFTRYGTIENCYNTGKVTRTDTTELGSGIIDYERGNGTTTNCYYLENTASSGIKETEDKQGQVESKKDAEMKDTSEEASFVNILNNGENNWKQDTENKNDGYPILSWQ